MWAPCAFSGCDTTFTHFGLGKIKVCSLIHSTPALREAAMLFYKATATPADTGRRSRWQCMAPVGLPPAASMSWGIIYLWRCQQSEVHLAPTSSNTQRFGAAHLQSILPGSVVDGKHVRFTWMGWRRNSLGLTAIPITKEPAPKELLNLVFWSCRKGCTSTCTSRKWGLKCTTALAQIFHTSNSTDHQNDNNCISIIYVFIVRIPVNKCNF